MCDRQAVADEQDIATAIISRRILAGDVGVFIGEIIQPRVQTEPPTPPFFAVSRRRAAPDGTFTGVVQVSVVPNELERFYSSIGRYPGAYYAMVRSDGTFLARHPATPNLRRLGPGTGFQEQSRRATRAAASISRARSSTGATA